MIYLTQLRTQLEQSFSPLACDCALTGDNSLTVKLYHPVSGQVDLVVSGLSIVNLRSPEAVAALIEELRYELETNALYRPETS
ncbi:MULTISPECIES: DUF1652 domain-containing protein [unclassified Pseudomonas]|uniref:DUF1652 domain-containing protein n=1 Tax=unclassified Pseudomonas TaxID=196821 RepID=UPI00191293A2|nr:MULTISPECIES: DUF1652 domain-containing protein [unclassified Pseudomonas]MBK5548759.1 DUF1652 domain-containing protein [Pseudomonas sp. TH03]MEB0224216.1 DUF1652 domain-containing protein [Pseudomonas sp. 5S1]MEB0294613.1 DUF1652 domain-containing protein [Pseudomonas sp. 10S4]WPX17666.1 DUF1652 domain-containing protein [Pseudomonas sp. 10S4]